MTELIERINDMRDLHVPDEIRKSVLAKDGGPRQVQEVSDARAGRQRQSGPRQIQESSEVTAGPRRRLRAKTPSDPEMASPGY